MAAIVDKLYALAQISANQYTIARDSRCVQGLIQFTASQDRDVANKALETLYLLASNANNRTFLQSNQELQNALDQLLRNPQTSPQIQINAQRIVRLLKSEGSNVSQTSTRPFADGSNTPSKRKAEEFTVKQMTNQTKRDLVEKVIVSLSGVVSVTMNPITQVVTVFGTASFELIQQALSAQKLDAVKAGTEGGKENATAQPLVTQEMLDAEQRKEKQRREEAKSTQRSTSLFSRIGRAFYLM